ncbi:ABC transporter ATP-binding protein [Zhihengliuella sp.]|uniref:ABC transporter ATP-binding protein n=1 Tax=Zhihengliuella sp. TaxID=1954483 RepID=UPI0028117552|nr:ABC transporter ATP-binding protein [Zhihengliuella sp.]
MSTPVLETENLVKIYGRGPSRFDALKGLTLEIHRGESVAIVGKSGSGKSTLMHLLALLDAPTAGVVALDGRPVSQLKPAAVSDLRNEAFGFVFQQFFLNAQQSVLENVTLPLKIAGVPRSERRRRGLDVLRQLEMDSKAENKANDLSGGQKQRVCIARALINDPSVIFADEPTGNLDSATSRVVEDILFGLHRERGITLVIVTHDDDLAARCQRRLSMQDGRIVNDDAATLHAAAAPAAAVAPHPARHTPSSPATGRHAAVPFPAEPPAPEAPPLSRRERRRLEAEADRRRSGARGEAERA